MFDDGALSDDKFLGGRLHLLQPLKGYRAATDPVFLAAACPARPGERVLELGCGVGAASLCLICRIPGVLVAGLEVQPAYAALARRNATRNQIDLEVHDGDLTQIPRLLLREFDHVIANPPFYARSGSPSPDEGRAVAMQIDVPLRSWVEAASRRLRPGGQLTMICGTGALPELLASFGTRLGSPIVLPLAPREGRPAPRILLRARKGGRTPLRLLAPLVIHQGQHHDGDREDYTAEANAVLREGADLLDRFK